MISPRTTALLSVTLVASSLSASAPVPVKKPVAPERTVTASVADEEFVPKIRVFNSAEIMQTSEFGKQEGEALKALDKELRESFEKKQQAFQKAVNEFQTQASTLSPAARDKKENQINSMGRDLESTKQTIDEEFKRAYQRASENLFNEVRQGVMEIAQKQNLDLIFDGNSGQLMYASERVLVTDDIKKAMDANFSKAKAPKPAAPKAPAQTAAKK